MALCGADLTLVYAVFAFYYDNLITKIDISILEASGLRLAHSSY